MNQCGSMSWFCRSSFFRGPGLCSRLLGGWLFLPILLRFLLRYLLHSSSMAIHDACSSNIFCLHMFWLLCHFRLFLLLVQLLFRKIICQNRCFCNLLFCLCHCLLDVNNLFYDNIHLNLFHLHSKVILVLRILYFLCLLLYCNH